MAEFERDPVRERTAAGLAAARARGRRGGRPSVMTAPKLQVARQMYAPEQYTIAAIAKTLGVSRASVYRHLTPSAAGQAAAGVGWTGRRQCQAWSRQRHRAGPHC